MQKLSALYEKLSFNFIRDIAPVASVMRAPQVLDAGLLALRSSSSANRTRMLG
jgi:hypothetical protein